MKKINLLLVLFLLSVLFHACGGGSDKSGFSFSKGVKKDLSTGTTTTYSGFDVDEIYIVGAEDKQLSNNEIPLDTKFSIVYEGVENYTLKEGRAFPGLSLEVTDASGNFILNEADLFSGSEEGYSAEDASVLRGSITVGTPMVAGETYHAKIRVFDKNSEAEIISELDFKVK